MITVGFKPRWRVFEVTPSIIVVVVIVVVEDFCTSKPAAGRSVVRWHRCISARPRDGGWCETEELARAGSMLSAGGLDFDGGFESANLAKVEHRGRNSYILWTKPDVEGVSSKATWFSFSVTGVSDGSVLEFEVRNMNPQTALYEHDMRAVHRSLPSQPDWQRLDRPCHHSGSKKTKDFAVHLVHKVACGDADAETLYFAFTFPYSYTDCQAKLAWLDSLFSLPVAAVRPPQNDGEPPKPAAKPYSSVLAQSQPLTAAELLEYKRDRHYQRALEAASEASVRQSDEAAAAAAAAAAVPTRAAAAALAGSSAPVVGTSSSSSGIDSLLSRLSAVSGRLTAQSASIEAEREAGQNAASRQASSSRLAHAAALSAATLLPVERPCGIYYHRELLVRSVGGRRVDLLTISDTSGMAR